MNGSPYNMSPSSNNAMSYSPPNKHRRMDMDVHKLLRKYKVFFIQGTKEFLVTFEGPATSPYEGGLWAVRTEVPDNYPFSSPSVGFINKIYHPNVDEASGSVCLDVINQKWSSLFDLCHIFDHFLPQLMQEPNVGDPLNQVAAQQMSKDKKGYDLTVREYIVKFARSDHWIKAIKEICPEPPTDDELSGHLNDLITFRRYSETLSCNSSSFINNNSGVSNGNNNRSLTGASSTTIFDLEFEDSSPNKNQSMDTSGCEFNSSGLGGNLAQNDNGGLAGNNVQQQQNEDDDDDGSLSSMSEYCDDENHFASDRED